LKRTETAVFAVVFSTLVLLELVNFEEGELCLLLWTV